MFHIISSRNFFFFKAEVVERFVVAIAFAALRIFFGFFKKHDLFYSFTEFIAFAAFNLK
jgi:hypothetical protein